MVSKFKLGQLVDRRFDALSSKYERVETSKLLTFRNVMIAGGNIKTTSLTHCCGRIDYVQALLNDVGTEYIFKFFNYEEVFSMHIIYSSDD